MSESLHGKTILTIGLARSGCAVGSLLRRYGARVIGVDDAPEAQVRRIWQAEGLTQLAATAFDEVHTDGDWSLLAPEKLSAVALSPGVPLTHPRVQELRQRGLPIHGELEWAARFFPGRLVAITGTNGKSTTTELVAHLARVSGWRAEALGNVGRPLSLAADQLGAQAMAVVEVSSFQLETIATFAPAVGAVLNLAPDHLDRYPDLASYYAAKRRLAAAVPPAGTFVTWTECREARSWPTAATTLLFGAREEGATVFLAGEQLWIRQGSASLPLLPVTELAQRSLPNLLNAQAAVTCMLPFAPAPESLCEGLRSFRGLPHRHQLVAQLQGVRFVDDSKATNVAAVCTGLAGYTEPVVLIAGGRGKGEDYAPLREVMSAVRNVVVIGEEGPALAASLDATVPVEKAVTMEAAVRRAAELARPTGTVLLSPACASFDMFRNYQERGAAFTAAALALGADAGGCDE